MRLKRETTNGHPRGALRDFRSAAARRVLLRSRARLFVVLFAAFAADLSRADGADRKLLAYVIRDVALVDVANSTIRPRQTVVLVGGTIAKIGDVSEVAAPPGAEIVDGARSFLIPSLIDAHVHYVDPDTYDALLVAYGVALVRDMGLPTEQALALRQKSRDPQYVGPELVVTGAMIDGERPDWPFAEACRTAAEGRHAVGKLADLGVDQIKVYNHLSPETHEAVVREAHRRNLRVVGHLPHRVSLETAIDLGHDGFDHLLGFESLLAYPIDGPPGARTAVPTRSQGTRVRHVMARLRASGAVVCPTLVATRGLRRERDGETDRRSELLPDVLRSAWRVGSRLVAAPPPTIKPLQELTYQLYAMGIPIISGTDLSSPQTFAGSSLHEEMFLLQQAGLPPGAVLQSATLVAAKFLGVDARYGSLAEGKSASCVLLSADPLQDIKNIAAIDGVFLRGKYFDRAALDQLRQPAQAPAKVERLRGSPNAITEGSGQVLGRGRYRVTLQGLPLATEDFVFLGQAEGKTLHAWIHPLLGAGAERFTTLTWSGGQTEARLEYAVAGQDVQATYSLEPSGQCSARASVGSEPVHNQAFALTGRYAVVAPAMSSLYGTLQALALGVGDEASLRCVGFGVIDWRMLLGKLTIRRAADQLPPVGGPGRSASPHYVLELGTDVGVLSGDLWTTSSGIPIKASFRTPWGEVEIHDGGQGGPDATPEK